MSARVYLRESGECVNLASAKGSAAVFEDSRGRSVWTGAWRPAGSIRRVAECKVIEHMLGGEDRKPKGIWRVLPRNSVQSSDGRVFRAECQLANLAFLDRLRRSR